MSPKRQRAIIISTIIIGFLIVGFFGLRAFFAFREFRRHGHTPPSFNEAFTQQPMETDVELIRDWMTIPYIAMTYHVHPKVLFDAVEISPRDNDEKSLAQLNEEYYPNQPEVVIELVKAAVRANQPPPTPTMPEVPSPPVTPVVP